MRSNIYAYDSVGDRPAVQSLITKVYGWMTLALIVTGGIAVYMGLSGRAENLYVNNPSLYGGLCLAEFALVIGLSFFLNSISASTAGMIFFAYAGLNGITLSPIFFIYTGESIALTFFVTAATFGAMSLYGYTTKKDLSSLGNLCMMGLIGLIIASIANWFFIGSPRLSWALTYLGVLVFTGLTAYDTWKIKKWSEAMEGESGEHVKKASIIGALHLYLDFVLLFVFLLRILGSRR